MHPDTAKPSLRHNRHRVEPASTRRVASGMPAPRAIVLHHLAPYPARVCPHASTLCMPHCSIACTCIHTYIHTYMHTPPVPMKNHATRLAAAVVTCRRMRSRIARSPPEHLSAATTQCWLYVCWQCVLAVCWQCAGSVWCRHIRRLLLVVNDRCMPTPNSGHGRASFRTIIFPAS